ncbi:pilus assembly protein [Rhizobacter sp. LjRoot28]|uniref:pilus assembly protein n=1 Tax=Rhizobacter sp. LjRoot28 TaxID=3342309 RepID=UPI003ECE7921
MNSSISQRSLSTKASSARALLVVAGWLIAAPAWSALAQISSVPLGTLSPEPPRVNLMFILDDSGSMERDFIPENTNGGTVYTGNCFGHSALNKVFFDPAGTYVVPPKADGSGPFDTPSFTAALVDGFNTGSNKVDLSKAPKWSSAGGSQFYYTTGVTAGTATKCAGLTPVTSITDSAMRTKYAIWYSFYRTRMLMMKSASGRALAGIDASKYRVGFTTINSTAVTDGDKFHNVGDFDQPISKTNPKTHRTAVLEKLYKATFSTYTPLRPALVKAGRYYANKLTNQQDPIQYICQRNFALLTTDGYWNTAAEPSNYKPLRPDGSEFSLSDGDAGKGAPYQDAFPYTLADIAQYYYETDLRPDLENYEKRISFDPDVKETVPQRMNTITLGLGVNGILTYNKDYNMDTLKSVTWPDPLTNPLNAGNSVVARIDDLWHAAVNGRGRYYSAANPNEVVESLKAALASASDSTGAAAAAAVSSISPTPGDDQVFMPVYEFKIDADQVVTTPWQGDLRAYRMKFDDKTGAVELPELTEKNAEWRAAERLDTRTSARTIYFNKAGSFADFDYTTLKGAGLGAHFDNRCADATAVESRFTQCSTVDKTLVTGPNLVNYLRGEEVSMTREKRVFRYRKSILGDIVNSSPVFVGKPPFRYTDSGYAGFVESNLKRKPMVYVGANDGMLHAFDASSGNEEWAFVPTQVIPNLWRLADAAYDKNHLAFVDASPTLADVFEPSKDGDSKPGTWRTVLVGGLGGGGRQFYAIEVTNPASPRLLWEYSVSDDANLGLSFGNPIVTKLKDGKWVAVFTSGYNNVAPGNGRGYLYVLDVLTGKPLSFSPIAAGTPASQTDEAFGTVTTPSNLGKINAWLHTDTDNTTRRIYGGDMLGNLWRFDLDDRIDPTGHEAIRLGVARDALNKIQPITTRPVLTALGPRPADDRTLVSFGTGKHLHGSDLDVYPASSPYSNKQAIYLVKDDLEINTADKSASLRSFLTPRQDLTEDKLDYSKSSGMYKDTTEARERVNVDGIQFNGLISFASNVPEAKDPCQSGGHSNLHYISRDGQVRATEKLDSLVVEGERIFSPEEQGPGDGSNGGKIIWTDKDGKQHVKDVPPPEGAGDGKKLRRAAWRELIE